MKLNVILFVVLILHWLSLDSIGSVSGNHVHISDGDHRIEMMISTDGWVRLCSEKEEFELRKSTQASFLNSYQSAIRLSVFHDSNLYQGSKQFSKLLRYHLCVLRL